MSKLIHLKPSLWRSFERACVRHEKLGERIVGLGPGATPEHLFRQLDHARERMYHLAGECHAIEYTTQLAIAPAQNEHGMMDPGLGDQFIRSIFG